MPVPLHNGNADSRHEIDGQPRSQLSYPSRVLELILAFGQNAREIIPLLHSSPYHSITHTNFISIRALLVAYCATFSSTTYQILWDLKVKWGEIRDGMRNAEDNHRDYGIARKFWSG